MDMEYEQRLSEMRGELELLKAQMQELLDAAEEPRIDTRAAVEPEARPFTVAEQVVNDAEAVKAGATACRSVEVAESGGLQQIYKFAGGGYAVTLGDLSTENPPTPLPVFLVRMNCTVDGVEAMSVAYCTLQTLKDALAGGGEGEAPTCGHPGNDLDDDHPGDDGGSGAGGSYYTPGGGTGHPGDDEGDNGVTPECGGDTLQADDPFGI